MLTEEQKEAFLKQHDERAGFRAAYHNRNLAAAVELCRKLKGS